MVPGGWALISIACKWMPQNSPMRPVDSPHKGPVTRKRFPFDDVTIMLQELVLADMGLEGIDVGAFCGIREISKLNIEHNKLTSPPQLCTWKSCLTDLNIGYNEISRLSKHYFRGFKKLKKINLTKTNLLVLPDLHWIQHSVSQMIANSNNIQSLGAFQTSGIYTRLRKVYVYDNDIRHFNVSLLLHMPQLDELHLGGNKLTHIDDFRALYVRKMHLAGNPWHCGEELSWMGEEDMAIERRLICATPTCLHGMAIADMSKWVHFSRCLCSCGLLCFTHWPLDDLNLILKV